MSLEVGRLVDWPSPHNCQLNEPSNLEREGGEWQGGGVQITGSWYLMLREGKQAS